VKRFFRFKRGERFWVGTTVLVKTGLMGCCDCFGNLYLTFPWAKFRPFDACAGSTLCNCRATTPAQ